MVVHCVNHYDNDIPGCVLLLLFICVSVSMAVLFYVCSHGLPVRHSSLCEPA